MESTKVTFKSEKRIIEIVFADTGDELKYTVNIDPPISDTEKLETMDFVTFLANKFLESILTDDQKALLKQKPEETKTN